MITLFNSEWERLWCKRWTWLLVLAIPGLAYMTASFFETLQVDHDTLSQLFILIGLRNNLYFPVDIIMAVFAASIFTEEYRGGQLRYVFLRQFTRRQIFFSKLLLICVCIVLMLILFAVCLIVTGYFFRFNENGLLNYSLEALSYTFVYYGWAFVSLLGISSLFICISMYSKNVTYAIGGCMLYILASLLLDSAVIKLAALFSDIPLLELSITYSLIPFLQHTGLNEVIDGNTSGIVAILSVVVVHLIVFLWGAYHRFVKSDYLY